MDKISYINAMQALTQLAHAVGNSSKEQDALISEIRERQKDLNTTSNREIVRNVVGMFYDGLEYGNWPWIVNGVNTLEEK